MARSQQKLQGPRVSGARQQRTLPHDLAEQRGMRPLLLELVHGQRGVHPAPPVHAESPCVKVTNVTLRASPVTLEGTKQVLQGAVAQAARLSTLESYADDQAALDAAAGQPPAVQIGVFHQQDAAVTIDRHAAHAQGHAAADPRPGEEQGAGEGLDPGAPRRHGRTIGPAVGLNSRAARFIAGRNKEHRMLALYIIVGFVVVLGAFNFIEFGRVD